MQETRLFISYHIFTFYLFYLSSVTSQPATSLKKNLITVIFQWFLKRFFRMLFRVRTLVKEQKELEVFAQIWFLKKADLKSFTKFIQKKLWWSPSLVKWQVTTLLKKNSPSQLSSYDFNKIFQNSCSIEHFCTAAFEGIKETYLIKKWKSFSLNHLLLEFINHSLLEFTCC